MPRASDPRAIRFPPPCSSGWGRPWRRSGRRGRRAISTRCGSARRSRRKTTQPTSRYGPRRASPAPSCRSPPSACRRRSSPAWSGHPRPPRARGWSASRRSPGSTTCWWRRSRAATCWPLPSGRTRGSSHRAGWRASFTGRWPSRLPTRSPCRSPARRRQPRARESAGRAPAGWRAASAASSCRGGYGTSICASTSRDRGRCWCGERS